MARSIRPCCLRPVSPIRASLRFMPRKWRRDCKRRARRVNRCSAGEDDEFRHPAGFATEPFVGNHQRRPGDQQLADPLDVVRPNRADGPDVARGTSKIAKNRNGEDPSTRWQGKAEGVAGGVNSGGGGR